MRAGLPSTTFSSLVCSPSPPSHSPGCVAAGRDNHRGVAGWEEGDEGTAAEGRAPGKDGV